LNDSDLTLYFIQGIVNKRINQMSPYERLRVAIESSGLTLKDYANQSGIAHKTLQNYATGTRKIGIEAMIKMCAQMNLNLNWLLTGEGEMYLRAGDSSNQPDTEKELCDVVGTLSAEQKAALLALGKMFASTNK
jgi:transcriptional regulator with XRE-family HTH domain